MDKVKVAITMGDPSGIGPAIISMAMNELRGLADFLVIGDKWVFNKAQSAKRKAQSFNFIDLNNVKHRNFSFGKVKTEYGKASIEYLNQAMELIEDKKADCLITCPISKEAINKAGFIYPGHTEYLSERTHTKNLAMMLLNRYLKFSLITRHIPLKKVSSKINQENLSKTISLTHLSLKRLFLIEAPRIVVCGLNPHASDNGIIGEEENRVIKPVLAELRKKIRNLVGPISADTAILRAKGQEFDCLIAMYHDQALIPLKLSHKDSGVNLTLGLPFVRTSPLHGTGFDIAKNPSLAQPYSLIEAIRLAVRCAANLKRV